jgi:hypothetical protein
MLEFQPFYFHASPALSAKLGARLGAAARAAIRAILLSHRRFDVAHQHVMLDGVSITFSSRIGARGDILVELDVGDPGLANRTILEADLHDAERRGKALAQAERRKKGISRD